MSSSSSGSPLRWGPNDGPYPITGIVQYLEHGKPIPVRREIDEWYSSGKAEDKLQHTGLTTILGIHGLPWAPWLDGSSAPTDPKQRKNYCTHNTILFPTWHRPYLLCFEQLVFAHMENFVKVGHENQEWPPEMTPQLEEAIKTWRLPYWDQGLLRKDPGDEKRKYHFPMICQREVIEIPGLLPQTGLVSPPGASESSEDLLRNPMYKFRFPGGKTMAELNCPYQVRNEDGTIRYDYNPTKATSRWAISATGTAWIEGENNYQHVVPELEEHMWYENRDDDDNPIPIEKQYLKTLAEAMSRLILPGYLDEYETYSSAQFLDQSKPIENLSIEDVHNNLHGWIGGIGHMSNIPTSAFDPIFWIHHANYDRLLALWQQTHPGKWIKDTYGGDHEYEYENGNWSIPRHTVVDGKTLLMPFYHWVDGELKPFDSLAVEGFAKYGYTYPLIDREWEVPYDESRRKEDIKKITAAVNEAYGTIRATLQKQVESVEPGAGREIRGLDPVLDSIEEDVAGDINDYIVNVIFDRYANQGGGYIIHILLGESSELNGRINLQGKAIAAGTVIALGNGLLPDGPEGSEAEGAGGCENCAKQKAGKILSTGQILLSKSILDQIVPNHDFPQIHRLNQVRDITEFLKENLHWKVTDFGGNILDINGDDFKDLKISAAIGKMIYYHDVTRPPKFGHYDIVTDITEHKPLGLSAHEVGSYYSV
ncbi:hypothetical protein TWF481_007496 [Arthrobotrys musiformis]|uniref:tyrosinase n=1 Tax=Arthrobotrys musiformis TaxID=47236 RepID=A0AAV9WDN7_9PEZI